MIQITSPRLRRLRRLADVPRWAVIPTIHKQSVAEHSFHVAHIALWLIDYYPRIPISDYIITDVLYYALIHDETEAITGDIPSPAGQRHIPGKSSAFEKTSGQGATTADDDVRDLLKVADLLEAFLFVKEEMALGNKMLDSILLSIRSRLIPLTKTYPPTILQDFMETYNLQIHPVDDED